MRRYLRHLNSLLKSDVSNTNLCEFCASTSERLYWNVVSGYGLILIIIDWIQGTDMETQYSQGPRTRVSYGNDQGLRCVRRD